MPLFSNEQLTLTSQTLLQAAGASDVEASIVAQHCVEANLAGHDSHGVIRIPEYIANIESGRVTPGASITVSSETRTTAAIDGGGGFGQVVMQHATKLAVKKAREAHIAAVTVGHQGHTGRLAAYTLEAAREGMVAIAFANSGRVPKMVAPFGGAAGRLHTNPISIAVPSDLDGPFHLDMATSASAWGTIRHAALCGDILSPGRILDKNGIASRDPNALFAGGVILPFGGEDGHKAYALSAMIQIICGLLTGIDISDKALTSAPDDCCFLIAIEVGAFRPLVEFKKGVADFAAQLKSTPTANGVAEVLYPGERSARGERKRREKGIKVEDATVSAFEELAQRFELPQGCRLSKVAF